MDGLSLALSRIDRSNLCIISVGLNANLSIRSLEMALQGRYQCALDLGLLWTKRYPFERNITRKVGVKVSSVLHLGPGGPYSDRAKNFRSLRRDFILSRFRFRIKI